MADENEKKTFYPINLPPSNPSDANSTGVLTGKPVGKRPEPVRNSGLGILGFLPGIVLILFGGLFLLSNSGYLEGEWWQYFLVGLGGVFLVEAMIRFRLTKSLSAKISRLITGGAFVIVGLLQLFYPDQGWPWVLVVIGVLWCVWFWWLTRRQKLVKSKT
jgi:hypothetical protein